MIFRFAPFFPSKTALVAASVFGLVVVLSIGGVFPLADPALAQSEASESEDVRTGRETGYPIPRFVSLKSGEVNMRRGPGPSYPIDWVYHRRGMPMEVVGEYDNWRKLRGYDGTEGWVHDQLLDGRRMALVKGGRVELYRRQEKSERGLVATVEPGVILRLLKCSKTWCRAEVGGYKGWLTREFLYGVYPDEEFD